MSGVITTAAGIAFHCSIRKLTHRPRAKLGGGKWWIAVAVITGTVAILYAVHVSPACNPGGITVMPVAAGAVFSERNG